MEKISYTLLGFGIVFTIVCFCEAFDDLLDTVKGIVEDAKRINITKGRELEL